MTSTGRPSGHLPGVSAVFDGGRLTFERMATGKLTDLLYEDTAWLPRAAEAAVTEDEKPKGGEDE